MPGVRAVPGSASRPPEEPPRRALGLPEVRHALRSHRPRPAALGEPARRAAVALVVREAESAPGAELLFILRAEDRRDPWSGHVGFPGGFQDPGDPDLLSTVVREVREELGLDLLRDARLLGRIDELQAMAAGRALDLVISPFVFELLRSVELRPNHEIQEAIWLGLDHLRDPKNATQVEYVRGGGSLRLPAIDAGGKNVWGLTYRMTLDLLTLLDRARPNRGRSAEGPAA